MKTRERDEARQLRRENGMSIRDIAERLGVSKSSVSLWTRGIELTPEQHAALLDRNPAYNHQRSGHAEHARRRRRERMAYQEHGRQLALIADPIHAAGCMLYWAEGAKSRNQVDFTNSDPAMMSFFLEFLRIYFGIRDRDVSITCHLYSDHEACRLEIENFWLSTLGLPSECLRNSIVNATSRASQGKRLRLLPNGTCKLRVSRTRIVQSLWGSIQEYARFERPEWLG